MKKTILRLGLAWSIPLAPEIIPTDLVAQPLAARPPGAAASEALVGADFSSIQDAPTQIVESKLVEHDADLPAYCRVKGYVAPQVGFVAWLPVSNWNGKLLELGHGGSGGTLDFPASEFCGDALQKGYACLLSDTGHEGIPTDGLWAYGNLQAKVDWGYRSTHVTLLAGKAIVENFYGKAPRKAYFMGGSTGGRQALIEAQCFPGDFDGIIALWPAVNDADTLASLIWNYRAMTGKDGKPLLSMADCQFVQDEVVARFDLNDGAQDKLIGDPRRCVFDPADLTRRDPKSGRSLTPIQAEAVRKVWAGPTTSAGKPLYEGCARPLTDLRQVLLTLAAYRSLIENRLRYVVFMPEAGPSLQLADFDFDRDFPRLRMTERLSDASNPDLRDFKAAGGKLMICQGWDDESPAPLKTVDYYETVERTLGGPAATRDFCRLFMVPGMCHGGAGDGPSAIDYLAYLEAWVERNRPPEVLIGAHIDASSWKTHLDVLHWRELKFPLDPASIRFTRPIYPFPIETRYKGTGNPNDAANFGPMGGSD